jgi:hypothetical protein
VAAVPGRTFSGTVSKISPLPDAMRMWSNPDLKVYKTQLNIEGGGDVLKSGMNCEAEIIVEQYTNTLYLPIQCVTRVDKIPSVWVKTSEGDERRQVEIGLDNNRFVRIISGLVLGDEVLLTPPLSGSVAGTATDVLEDVEIPSMEEFLVRAETERLATLERGSNNGKREGGGNGAGEKKPDVKPTPAVAVTSEKAASPEKSGAN